MAGLAQTCALAINLLSSHVDGQYHGSPDGVARDFNEKNYGLGIACPVSENVTVQGGFYLNSYTGKTLPNGEIVDGRDSISPYLTVAYTPLKFSTDAFNVSAGVVAGLAHYNIGEEVGLPFGNVVPMGGAQVNISNPSNTVTFSANAMPVRAAGLGSDLDPSWLVTGQLQIALDSANQIEAAETFIFDDSPTARAETISWQNNGKPAATFSDFSF